jgi:hypothetical protein
VSEGATAVVSVNGSTSGAKPESNGLADCDVDMASAVVGKTELDKRASIESAVANDSDSERLTPDLTADTVDSDVAVESTIPSNGLNNRETVSPATASVSAVEANTVPETNVLRSPSESVSVNGIPTPASPSNV